VQVETIASRWIFREKLKNPRDDPVVPCTVLGALKREPEPLPLPRPLVWIQSRVQNGEA
jgi:hypothetical protein